jgi:hypothetical protein
MRQITVLLTCLLLGLATAEAQAGRVQTGNITAASSNCSVAGSCVTLSKSADDATVAVEIGGTFSNTLNFEGTIGGLLWVPVAAQAVDQSAISTTATAAGSYQVSAPGLIAVRVRGSGGSPTGSASITLQSALYSTRLKSSGGGGGGGSPGGSSGQVQYNDAGSFAGFTLAGDCTLSQPSITCTKTNGSSFAASATTDTTSATNITAGTLAAARMNPSVTAHTFLGNNTGSSAAAAFLRLACADLSDSGAGCTGSGGGSTSPGGTSGQIQYNLSGSFAGFTYTGDCTVSVPAITCTKTNGSSFAASATTDTTSASNISAGTLAAARMNPTVSAHTFLGNNTGSSTAAAFNRPACADLSDSGTACTGTSPAGAFVGTTDTQTLTNKRLTRRVVTASDATSITPNTDAADITYQSNTQSTGTLTINADSGTPTNGQAWILKIKSSNVQTFSWNAVYVGGTTALAIATTGGGKIDYFGFIYDGVNSKWDFVPGPQGF